MNKFSSAFLLLSIFFLSLTAVAKDKKYDVDVVKNLEVNGVQLKAGTYQIALEGDAVHFYRNGKDVVSVPVHAEPLQTKTDRTALVTTDNKLNEIFLEGTNTKLVVGP